MYSVPGSEISVFYSYSSPISLGIHYEEMSQRSDSGNKEYGFEKSTSFLRSLSAQFARVSSVIYEIRSFNNIIVHFYAKINFSSNLDDFGGSKMTPKSSLKPLSAPKGRLDASRAPFVVHVGLMLKLSGANFRAF